MKTLYPLLLIIITLLAACQKEVNDLSGTNGPSTPDCKLTKWIEGSPQGGPNDTVYVFSYDAQRRMAVIVDSGYNDDSRILKYQSGRLSEMFYVDKNVPTDTFSIAKYTYTTSGLLKQVESYYAIDQKFVFYYGTDTLPTSLTYYRENLFLGGMDSTQFRYQWQNGNMIKAERLYNGTWITDEELTYSNVPNQMKFLTLLAFSEKIEIWREPYMFFNKNMEQTDKYYYDSTSPTTYIGFNADYSTDSTGNLVFIQRHADYMGVPSGLNTMYLFYTCK